MISAQPITYSTIPLFAALCVAFAIPIWSLYLLVRDLTQFYFVGQQPGYHGSSLFNPTFALSGLAFPQDEGSSTTTKTQILVDQYTDDFIHFVVPLSEAEARLKFDPFINTGGEPFHPDTRRQEALTQQGVIVRTVNGNPLFMGRPHSLNKRNFDHFNVTLALAGLYDRPLHQEVAKIEVSLVRHNLALRGIVIRYVKSLLTMVLLFLASFIVCSIIEASPSLLSKIKIWVFPADEFLVAVTLMVWALLAWLLIQRPIKWIYKTSDPRYAENRPELKRDPSLIHFQKWFGRLCAFVAFMSSVCLALRLLAL